MDSLAKIHIEQVMFFCEAFLSLVLEKKCAMDIKARLWAAKFEIALKKRHDKAIEELDRLAEDIYDYPINYNHYYTDTIRKLHTKRNESTLYNEVDLNKASAQEALDCMLAIYKVRCYHSDSIRPSDIIGCRPNKRYSFLMSPPRSWNVISSAILTRFSRLLVSIR